MPEANRKMRGAQKNILATTNGVNASSALLASEEH
jgi:hypothetical protein